MLSTFLRRLFRRKPELLGVGSRAPEFEALDHQGRRVRLSDFRGRRVILWFYPKASTPG
jgi:peroxiredoxin Q/BCP